MNLPVPNGASISIQAGETVFKALRLLELGRGVMACVYLETRSDIAELKKAQPELAEKSVLLRNELDMTNDSVSQNSLSDVQQTRLSQVPRRYEAWKEFDEVVRLIQSIDGFKDFFWVNLLTN